MSFIRPELKASLTRWREALVGAGVILGAGRLALVTYGIPRGFFLSVVILGVGILIEGIRRARLPRDGGGAGVVEVDERQITYFGPEGGGGVSVDALRRIEIRTTDAGPFDSDFFWVFFAEDRAPLIVPGNAEGAAQIFDALAVLKGVDFEKVIAAAGSSRSATYILWSKEPRALH